MSTRPAQFEDCAILIPASDYLVETAGMAPKERGRHFDNIIRKWLAGTIDETCPQWVHEQWAAAEKRRWRGMIKRCRSAKDYGPGWRALRLDIIARDGSCRLCGGGGRLDVHHRIPRRKFQIVSEADAPSNLVALCRSCHKKEDAEFDRSGLVLV